VVRGCLGFFVVQILAARAARSICSGGGARESGVFFGGSGGIGIVIVVIVILIGIVVSLLHW